MDDILMKFKNHKALIISLLSMLVLILNVIFAYFYFQKQNSSLTIPQPSQSQEVRIFVDISGEVVSPGVYALPLGSRVDDLIKRAGGFSSKADKVYIAQNFNLARLLADQDKFFVPSYAQTKTSTSTIGSSANSASSLQNPNQKISLNQASVEDLIALPAIGEISAKKIVANRPYSNLEELTFKKILSKSQFQKIQNLISL